MRQIFILSFSVFFFSLSSILAQSNCVAPDGTIIVDNIDDAGPGSLRAAIHCANANAGESTIVFNLPGNEDHIIYVGASTGLELPALLSTGTIIDGTTQAGFGSNGDFSPKIILDGSQHNWTNAINALWVRASYCEVYGLEIRNFPDDGIDVNQADYCIIGAPNKGNIIYANGAIQDEFPDATPGPWEGCGIVLRNGASNCIVQGNIIGTDETLSPSLSNEYCGIINRTNSNFNLIGGSLPGEANIIAYQAVGVRISNAFACQLVQNSFFCNDSISIQLVNNGNLNAQKPLINQVTANAISGLAAAAAIIDVFAVDNSNCGTAPCQGKTYLGTTNTINGTWTLNAPFAANYSLSPGEKVTALARDAIGNSSAFAICNTFGATSACTDDLGNIWVQNTNDAGAGSLRAAIECANATPGANTIKFNLDNTKDTIRVGQTTGLPLPALTDPGTTIDGTTHAIFGNGGNYQPRIVLDGAFHAWTAPIDALWIQADFCAIYGLEIVNFPDDGIDVTAANYCQIGGVNQGNVVYNNGWEQDYFPDLPNTGPWNGCAIVLRNGASYCKVVGNTLGTDYQQQSTLGNEYCGVIVQHGGDYNQIGGEQAGAGNIIAHHLIGINLSNNSIACSFLRNEMYCNTLDPIRLQVNANNYPQAPSINLIQTNVIAGQASSGDRVDVYRVADNTCTELCQGATYLGTAIASNGNWSLTPPFANGINLASNDVITAIATDAAGNSSDFAVCNSLTVGCGITVSISHFNHASCGSANGAVTFNILGGSGFYAYDLGAGNGQSANPIITNIAPGNYTVTISDLINNCSIYYNLLIENRGIPAVQIDSLQATTCALDNGYLAVSVIGGAPPYTYDLGNGINSNAIFPNLAAGTYNLTVSDVNACSTTSAIIIGDSDAPDLQLISQTNASCNLGNGSIEVSASGGLSPYYFDLGDGPTDDAVFTGLTEGNYAITVTDAAACTSIVSVDISNSGIPVIDSLTVTDETCFAGNGAINIVPTGGLPPYTYELGNTTNTSGVFNNLSAGVYALTLTDAANCVFTQNNITVVNIGENPLADFNQSTTGLALNLNNNSSNAVSYLWDFGDGNTSTMATPNYSYAWSGYYNLCLTVTNDCGTDTSCKGIIILDPNEALLDFEVGALDGEVGQLVQLPVRVNQFMEMSAFQFSLRLENPAAAKFLGATSFNLGGLSAANFSVTDETLTCDWSVANPNGISVPDETILFYLVVEIMGTGGDCTPIVFADTPIQREAFRQINGLSIKVPTTVMDGLLCVLAPLASVNVFGKVEKENGVVIANAQVNCTGVDSSLTLADGSYAFEDLALGDYVIQPFNDNNPGAGVSVLDVFLMQQHILNINYLDSPYQIIAADVDQSGSVSVLDVFELQRIILNLLDDFSNNTSWRFIPKSHVFANPQFPLGTNFPESVTLTDLNADTSMVDFIAIKVGDMTLNANLSNRPPKVEDKYFYTEEQRLEAGKSVKVDFRLTDLEKIAAYQFELNFDTDYLVLETAESQTSTNNPHQFGDRYLEEGILSTLWIQDFTKELHPEDAVFTLTFKALKAGKLSEHLGLSARHLSKNAFEADGKTWGLALRFDKQEATTQNLSLLQQYPNPFATETAIYFALSETSLLKFEVYDPAGKLVYQHEETYPAGKQLIQLRQTDLPGAGVYFYHLQSAEQRITQKIIHQP